MDLDTLSRIKIWEPLGMNDTMFNPPASLVPRIAATGYSPLRDCIVRGETQDDQDFALGGIAGCDGVFSTTSDLAIFCQMILNGGSYGCASILPPQSIKQMTKNQTPQVSENATDLSPLANLLLTPKGYGWELRTHRFSNGGVRFSHGCCGKAGGAGTFMWIDRKRDLFGIILTNHGLPNPFDEPGWNKMLDDIGTTEFFDGIVNAVTDGC
jgi:CubicO group peptidase (beta-lactamase class C family)